MRFYIAQNNTYGFDAPSQQEGAKYETFKRIDSTVLVPWKSLGIKPDEVMATVQIRDTSTRLDSIVFRNGKGQQVFPKNPKAQPFVLTLTGSGHKNEDEITAYYKTTDIKGNPAEIPIGQLQTISYTPKKKNVVLVPVGSVTLGDIQTELNRIYGQAVCEWTVTVASPFTISSTLYQGEPGAGTISIETGMFKSYTGETQAIIDAYKQANPVDKNTCYLFVTSIANDKGYAGYMPLNAQFGFIFTGQGGSTPRTIAHELGHSLGLKHPYEANDGRMNTEDNLMAYSNSTRLHQGNWKEVHDWDLGLGWGQKEEDGADKIKDLQNLLQTLALSGVNTFAFGIKCEAPITDGISYYMDGYRYFIFKYSIINGNYSFEQIKSIGFPKISESKVKFPELIIPGNFDRLLILNKEVLGVVTPFLCEVKEKYPNACTIKDLTNIPNFYVNLEKDISKCINNYAISQSDLTLNELGSILKELPNPDRPYQKFEIKYNDKVYRLNELDQAVLVENPLSDADIDAGNWTDNKTEMYFRLGFNSDGIIQYTALGIYNKTPIAKIGAEQKEASITTIAANMKSRNNALLAAYKVKNITTTLNDAGATFDTDEFPDKKKIDIDETASFLKLLREAGGIGLSFLKTAEVEKPVYLERQQNIIKAPPICTGALEGGAMAVTDITGMVNTVYDLITDKETRTKTKEGFVEIGRQVADDPSQLFPILGESILEDFAGSNSEGFNEMFNDKTNPGRKGHLISKTTIKAGASIVLSGEFLTKLPKLAKEIAAKMVKAKSMLKFKKVGGDIGEISKKLIKDFEEKLKSLPDGGKMFLEDFANSTDEVIEAILRNPNLVDSWKKVDELVENGDDAFKTLKKDPDFLKKYNDVANDADLNKHIFDGELKYENGLLRDVSGVHSNKNLKPSSQTDGLSRGDIRIQPDTKNDLGKGYYEAKVQVYGDKGAPGGIYVNGWTKGKKSTFFPDSWSPEKIHAEIANGIKNKVIDSNFPTSGGNVAYMAKLSDGTKLQMVYSGDKLISAFPNLK